MQGRTRVADVENGYVDVGEEGEGEMNEESRADICTLPNIK